MTCWTPGQTRSNEAVFGDRSTSTRSAAAPNAQRQALSRSAGRSHVVQCSGPCHEPREKPRGGRAPVPRIAALASAGTSLIGRPLRFAQAPWRLRPSRSSFVTTSVSPARSSASAWSSSGRDLCFPEACSANSRSQPLACWTSACPLGFCFARRMPARTRFALCAPLVACH